MVVHRLTGDGAKKDLIAPLWSANKKKVLNYINARFKQINLNQGELLD
jgi:radical SAM superfamily enzyme